MCKIGNFCWPYICIMRVIETGRYMYFQATDKVSSIYGGGSYVSAMIHFYKTYS